MKKKKIIIFLVLFCINSYAFEESLDKFVLTGYDKENNKKWELQGDKANIAGKDIDLTDLVGKVYEKDKIIYIKADKGFIDKNSKEVSLKENVIVKDSEGTYLYTNILNWNQETEIIWTDVDLRLVKNENEVTGTGGELDTKFSKALIKKDVELKIIPQTIITSDGPLEMDYIKNIAIFTKNVHVVDRRGEMFCDSLTVYFDPEKKSIIKSHAKGDVKLRRGNSWSYSQEAVYDTKNGTISLLGRPKLEIYPQE